MSKQRRPQITKNDADLAFYRAFYLWVMDQSESALDYYCQAAEMYERLASNTSSEQERDLLICATNALLKTRQARDMVRVGNRLRKFQKDFSAHQAIDSIAKRLDALSKSRRQKKRRQSRRGKNTSI